MHNLAALLEHSGCNGYGSRKQITRSCGNYIAIRLVKQAYFFYFRVFYQASRDISPGQELLIHYGKQCAKYMGIWSEYNFSRVTLLAALLTSVIIIRRTVERQSIFQDVKIIDQNPLTFFL